MNSRDPVADLSGSDERVSFFRALAESSPDLIVCHDVSLHRIYINAAARKAWGEQFALGGSPGQGGLLPPAAAADYAAAIHAVLASGEARELTFIVPDAQGGEGHFHARAVPRHGDDGSVAGVIVHAQDMTARVRIEADLAARVAEFRALAENSPDVIVRYNRNCRRIYVNPAYERRSGIAVADLLDKSPTELTCLPPVEAARYQQWLADVMAEGATANIEVGWKQPDGKRRAQHIVAVPERGRDGNVSGVLTIARDISDLKDIQARLEQAEAMARLGYWQWDCHVRKATLSDQTCRIFGQDCGWSPSIAEVLDQILPDEREWIVTAFNIAVASQSPDVSLDYRIRVDERIVDLHSSIRFEYSTDGQPSLIVGTTQDVSQMKHYEQRVHALAHYDALTDLPNRDMFADSLGQATAEAASRGHDVGVLVLDLDNFKAINDTLGHAAGDRVLRETAARLRGCVREYDVVARLGGDEFGFVLTALPARADVSRICAKILTALGEAYRVGESEVFLTGSIGVARYPADSEDAAALLQFADAAMYQAKQAGRNNHQFYAANLTRQTTHRLSLAACLRRAEANRELELFYQPQIDLSSGRLVGAEALLRWNHPEEGLLTPDRFIGIAEETGFIVGIGAWVLRTACEAACVWNRGRRHPIKIAVNLSPRQFKGGDLVATVADILSDTGCNPAWLELEITESLLVEDADDVGRTLDALRAMKLSIAIDDFGTGYSALSYLNRFSIDTIKIDRSFVRDIVRKRDSAELVKAIIAMARSLRLSLVAEGIEQRSQEQFLHTHGCQIGQGYLYGKPMRYQAFEGLIGSGAER